MPESTPPPVPPLPSSVSFSPVYSVVAGVLSLARQELPTDTTDSSMMRVLQSSLNTEEGIRFCSFNMVDGCARITLPITQQYYRFTDAQWSELIEGMNGFDWMSILQKALKHHRDILRVKIRDNSQSPEEIAAMCAGNNARWYDRQSLNLKCKST